MEKVLSVVIPAYNSQNYIDRVLRSLLEPSVMPYLDIIVVNDGSSDRTAEVCQTYCSQWPESIRLISQPNKGHGGAINTGIAAAVGKYVKIIDSDDWVETDNLPAFVSSLRNCTCDAVLTHFSIYNIVDQTVTQWKSYPEEFNRAYSLSEILNHWGSFNQVTSFHGITYRTDFFRSTGVRLSEHVYYEDQEYCIIPFSQVHNVMPLNMVIYDYRVGDVNQSMSDENLKKNIAHFQKVLNGLIAEYDKIPADSSARRSYYSRMLKSLIVSYLITVMLTDGNRKEGRRKGAQILRDFHRRIPRVYCQVLFPYAVLRTMNLLGISKRRCDQLLSSEFYTKLRYRKDLNVLQPSEEVFEKI